MKHEHEALVTIDGLIKCRVCGEILPCAERVLGKVTSALIANELLDKIAIEGKYQITSKEGGFVVYSKDKNGIREEVSARKKSERVYVIYQKLITK